MRWRNRDGIPRGVNRQHNDSAVPAFASAANAESGYLILTMMPSLRCRLRCPHCYLSIEERTNGTMMKLDELERIVDAIARYYNERQVRPVDILAYWYGGEPTQMGVNQFEEMCQTLQGGFSESQGFRVRHRVLSALVGVKTEVWEPVIRRWARGEIQTSYDGTMRGIGYDRRWERNVRQWVDSGVVVDSLSVVNRALIECGPKATVHRLSTLGVRHAGLLPFLKNRENEATGYERWHASMDEFSDFALGMIDEAQQMRTRGQAAPQIAVRHQILEMRRRAGHGGATNTGAQTLFLMPDGSCGLPDYDERGVEFLNIFGNLLRGPCEGNFARVLASPARRAWLRRQGRRGGDRRCARCDIADCCVMEFWGKPNPLPDAGECWGAERLVRNVLDSGRAQRWGARAKIGIVG